MNIIDHKEGRYQTEIYGYIQPLEDNDGKLKFFLVTSNGDCLTIKDLINSGGNTVTSIIGRRLMITIEDERE